MDEGCYLWNGGMFIWKTSNIIELTKQHLSSTYELLNEIAVSDHNQFEQKLFELYPKVESISVDYGIMEKPKKFV